MDPTIGFDRLTAVLRQLGIRFAVAGSLASSLRSTPRLTRDIDLIAELTPGQVDTLAAALHNEFYADAGMMREALERGRAFNLMHYGTAYKFDLFPVVTEYQRNELARSREIEAAPFGTTVSRFPLISAEDSVLAKLSWFKQGGCVSEQQWRDVAGVIRVQAGRLDLPYLREWAPRLGIADLLEEALAEGGFRS